MDARKHTLLLTFNRDDKYVFTPHIKDLAEATENPVYDGVTQDFVIDQKAPVMDVEYKVIDNGTFAVPMQEENRAYSNKAVRTIVTINEHNFALEGKDIQADVQVQATKVGEGETVPDYNAQQQVNDGNVWVQQNVDTYKGSVKNFVALVKNGSFLVRITDMTILIEKEFIYGSSKRPNPADYYRKQHYQCG